MLRAVLARFVTGASRRAFLRRVAVTASGVATLSADARAVSRPTEPAIDGYRTFQYDDANTGSATGHRGPTSDPVVLWTFDSAGPFPIDSPSSLAVADGRVFVGYEQGGFFALDAADGAALWHRDDDDDASFGIPTVADDGVYVHAPNRAMYVFDAATGAERTRWEEGTGAPIVQSDGETITTGVDGYGGANVFADDEPVLELPGSFSKPAAYTADVLCLANDGDEVYAVDTSGQPSEWAVRWSYTPDDLNSTGDPPAPTIDGGTVYVGGGTSTGGALIALDIADGTERWRVETEDELNHSVVVVDDMVYVGDLDGRVYAFAAADGTERWRADAAAHGHLVDGVGTPPAVADGVVYVGSEDNRIYAFDATDGTELWRFRTNGNVISLAVASGIVFAVVGNGRVHALTAPAVSPVPIPEGAAASISRPNWPTLGDIGAAVVTLGAAAVASNWLLDRYAGDLFESDPADSTDEESVDAERGVDDPPVDRVGPPDAARTSEPPDYERDETGQFTDRRNASDEIEQ